MAWQASAALRDRGPPLLSTLPQIREYTTARTSQHSLHTSSKAGIHTLPQNTQTTQYSGPGVTRPYSPRAGTHKTTQYSGPGARAHIARGQAHTSKRDTRHTRLLRAASLQFRKFEIARTAESRYFTQPDRNFRSRTLQTLATFFFCQSGAGAIQDIHTMYGFNLNPNPHQNHQAASQWTNCHIISGCGGRVEFLVVVNLPDVQQFLSHSLSHFLSSVRFARLSTRKPGPFRI